MSPSCHLDQQRFSTVKALWPRPRAMEKVSKAHPVKRKAMERRRFHLPSCKCLQEKLVLTEPSGLHGHQQPKSELLKQTWPERRAGTALTPLQSTTSSPTTRLSTRQPVAACAHALRTLAPLQRRSVQTRESKMNLGELPSWIIVAELSPQDLNPIHPKC